MSSRHGRSVSRRQFLGGVTVVGGSWLVGLSPRPVAAEPPPETSTIRLIHDPAVPVICYAPLYVAEDLLRGEGITDIRYVKPLEGSEAKTLAAGQADLSGVLAATHILAVDTQQPLLALAGLHIGCLEVVGTGPVRSIRDLKGRTVAVSAIGADDYVFLAGMLAYVGIDPRRDVTWAALAPDEAMRRLAKGQIDAIVAFPPFAQELRAKRLGRVVVNSGVDRPWSQYFCCMVAGNRDFVRQNPVSTKRALRAVLKANQLCAQEPERTARLLVERGFGTDYAYTLAAVKAIPYGVWRGSDPENTLTFYGLRLRDAGLVKSSPQKIISQGTDWRFLSELKRELKG